MGGVFSKKNSKKDEAPAKSVSFTPSRNFLMKSKKVMKLQKIDNKLEMSKFPQ